MIITSYVRRWLVSHRSKLEAINFEKELEYNAKIVYDYYTAHDKFPEDRNILVESNGNWYIRSNPPTGMRIHSPMSCYQTNNWVTPNGYYCGNIQSPITSSLITCNQYPTPQSFDVSNDYLTNPNLTNQCKLDISISKINDFTKKLRHDYNHLTDSEKGKFENDAANARAYLLREAVSENPFRTDNIDKETKKLFKEWHPSITKNSSELENTINNAKQIKNQAEQSIKERLFKTFSPRVQKILLDSDVSYRSIAAKLDEQQPPTPPKDRLLKEGQTPLPPTLGPRRKIKY